MMFLKSEYFKETPVPKLLSRNSCPETLVPKLLSPNSCPQTPVTFSSKVSVQSAKVPLVRFGHETSSFSITLHKQNDVFEEQIFQSNSCPETLVPKLLSPNSCHFLVQSIRPACQSVLGPARPRNFKYYNFT